MYTNKFKFFIILLFIITLLLSGCDSSSSNQNSSENLSMVDKLELTRKDKIFQMNQYTTTIIINKINKGSLYIDSDRGKTYPEKINFNGNEVEIKRLFTPNNANKLIIDIKNTEGNSVDQITLNIDG